MCAGLRDRIAGAAGEAASIEQQVGNLIEQIASTQSEAMRDRYEAKVVELVSRKTALDADREQAEAAMAKAQKGSASYAKWTADLATLKRELADPDIRLRLRAHLREFIAKVEVFAVGYQKRYDGKPVGWLRYPKDGERLPLQDADDFEGEASAWADMAGLNGTAAKFVEFVMDRRMSRHGRFVRVHFTTGSVVDLVPKGSIASGSELSGEDGGRRYTSPDLMQLWQKFAKLYGKHGQHFVGV